MSTSQSNSTSIDRFEETSRVLNGLLAAYQDDQLNECVNSALKRKSRVRYKCMDTFSNFLAFGTTGGAIYLFKLKSIIHSSCTLVSMIPCDQGSIEVIKFLPNPQADDLLVAIGTSRGSLVVFRLTELPCEQNPICDEIYRAESFTNNCGIKMIEYDQDLLNPSCSFTKLYVCDVANRLYVLESSSIYPPKPTLRLFYSNHLPALIFSVNDSNINQISVHRSQLLISTNETTRFFNEHTNQLITIGRRKRREGFYGACFFNPNYKPLRIVPVRQDSQQTIYSSTGSLNEIENLLIFVARPMFRLWQVNNKHEVMFTHQFEPLIRSSPGSKVLNLYNQPPDDSQISLDDPSSILEAFNLNKANDLSSNRIVSLKCDHFQRLIPIYSPTLGNLLLSYTQNEIFIIDPIGATLVLWHSHETTIVQICCNENEIFVWSLVSHEGQQQQFQVNRLVLLAPTQFVLELHRTHRYLSLVLFVQLFCDQFRRIMALPLSGARTITTEGGLLRNILLNAWDILKEQTKNKQSSHNFELEYNCEEYEKIINEILDESKQLKQSLENLSDSRFFLAMTTENIERLCCEPYTSLLSLEISLANLHTNHVIHFSKDALNRHKSVANLAQSIKNLTRLKQKAQSNCNISRHCPIKLAESNLHGSKTNCEPTAPITSDTKVIVERQRPNNLRKHVSPNGHKSTINEEHRDKGPFFSVRGRDEVIKSREEEFFSPEHNSDNNNEETNQEVENETTIGQKKEVDWIRCSNCRWPRPRSHLKPMHSSQKIQFNWIQENLLPNFEENIDQIEERALKHGLWHLLLKCFAFKNKLDEYITCCIMLDDVRLLNIEQFVITKRGEDEIIECLLEHLGRKVDLTNSIKAELGGNVKAKEFCLKCKSELDQVDNDSDSDQYVDNLDHDNQHNNDDEISFSLVNLFEQFMMRRNADIKRCVSHLLRHPKLLNDSKIPAKFYLKAIAFASSSSSGGYNFGN